MPMPGCPVHVTSNPGARSMLMPTAASSSPLMRAAAGRSPDPRTRQEHGRAYRAVGGEPGHHSALLVHGTKESRPGPRRASRRAAAVSLATCAGPRCVHLENRQIPPTWRRERSSGPRRDRGAEDGDHEELADFSSRLMPPSSPRRPSAAAGASPGRGDGARRASGRPGRAARHGGRGGHAFIPGPRPGSSSRESRRLSQGGLVPVAEDWDSGMTSSTTTKMHGPAAKAGRREQGPGHQDRQGAGPGHRLHRARELGVPESSSGGSCRPGAGAGHAVPSGSSGCRPMSGPRPASRPRAVPGTAPKATPRPGPRMLCG